MNFNALHVFPNTVPQYWHTPCTFRSLHVLRGFLRLSSDVGVMEASLLLCLVGVKVVLGLGVGVDSVPLTGVRLAVRGRLLGEMTSGEITCGVRDRYGMDVTPKTERNKNFKDNQDRSLIERYLVNYACLHHYKLLHNFKTNFQCFVMRTQFLF